MDNKQKESTRQGFKPLTREEVRTEADQVLNTALRKDNNGQLEASENNLTVEYDYRGQEAVGYKVKEKERTKFLGFGGSNASIQEVAYDKHISSGKLDRAILRSSNNENNTGDLLTGYANGVVTIKHYTTDDDGNRVGEEMDITTLAAQSGITAAGIRRTQKDIAADGEVTRPEQEKIIELINRAKSLAK